MFFQVFPNLYSLVAQTPPLGPITQTPAAPSETCQVSDSITNTDFVDLIRRAEGSFEGVRTSWDEMWNFIFTATGAVGSLTSLYGILSIVGQVLAVGTLLFFMLQWFKDINEGNVSRPISELLWPLLAAFLLGFSSIPGLVINNSINPLGSIISGLRQEYQIWEDNLYTLPGLVGPDSIENSFGTVNAVVNTQSIVQNFVAQCSGTGNEGRNGNCNCYKDEINRSIRLIRGYQEVFDGQEVLWWNQRLSELVDAEDSTNEDFQAEFQPGGNLAWARPNPGRSDNQNFLSALQVSFRQTIEIALLFTAMLGPVAIGVSLLPVPIAQKSIVSWLSGLAAIGSAKFFFFIVVGITSQVFLNIDNPPVDLSWFAIFMNTIAPLLAMGLASGGGAALFNGLNNFVTFTRT